MAEEVIKTTRGTPPMTDEPPAKAYHEKKAIFRAYQVIWYILGVVEVLLLFRIMLKVLAANPFSGFANLIYFLTEPLVAPFNDLFRITVTPQGSVFEWTTIVAGLVYFLVAWGLVQLMQLIKPVSSKEVEQTVDNP